MKSFNDCLFEKHILFELTHRMPNKISILFEDRSVVPGIDTILNNIFKMIEPQIYETVRQNGKTVAHQYKDIEQLGIKNTFFKSIDFSVQANIGDSSSYVGGYNPSVIKYEGENTKIDLSIFISVTGTDESDLRRIIYFAFGHEIVHAYDVYQWVIKNKKDYSPTQQLANSNYLNFKSLPWDSGNEKAIKNAMYRLSRLERNAYIGQLRQELLRVKDSITDSKSALNAIKNTESYNKNYLYFDRFLDSMVGLYVDKGEDAEETKNDVIYYANKICSKNFTNYRQVLKYFTIRCRQYQKIYMIKASKIVSDIYQEQHPVIGGQEL